MHVIVPAPMARYAAGEREREAREFEASREIARANHVSESFKASYRYRAAIRAAVATYNKRYRAAWVACGSPIPPGPECAEAMIAAWVACAIAWRDADRELNKARAGT